MHSRKKDLSVLVPEKQDAFSRILRFMTKSDITLNANEEAILDRWCYCDVLMRSRKKTTDEIVADMVKRWDVSKFTAINDINATQKLFAKSRDVNKKYLLHHHIEQIGLSIQKAGLKDTNLELMPKLFDSYTKAIQALPDDETADKLPPPIMNFFIAPGQQLSGVPTIEDAIAQADEILMQANVDGVYEIKKDE